MAAVLLAKSLFYSLRRTVSSTQKRYTSGILSSGIAALFRLCTSCSAECILDVTAASMAPWDSIAILRLSIPAVVVPSVAAQNNAGNGRVVWWWQAPPTLRVQPWDVVPLVYLVVQVPGLAFGPLELVLILNKGQFYEEVLVMYFNGVDCY